MALYATVAQIKALGIQTDAPATATTVWDDLAEAASRMFDRLVEVQNDFFSVPSVYSDRTFIGNGSAYLMLPPYVELNPTLPVAINEGTIDDEDYVDDNVPEYAEVDGMLVVLAKTKRSWWPNIDGTARFEGWPQGKQIEVSAKWGFVAIPKDIQIAVSKIALNQWRMSDPVNADNVNATSEPLVDGIPASVWATVEKYREKYSTKWLCA